MGDRPVQRCDSPLAAWQPSQVSAAIRESPRVTTAAGPRVAALDGLRGFAALAVVTLHLVIGFGLLPYPPGGAIGVLVFFVLSGYLIAGICWRRRGTAVSYRAFLRRRVSRLAPALGGLVVVGLPAMIILGGEPLVLTVRDAALATGQLTGFAVALGVGVHPAWQPTWSLTVEWTYYVLAPLLLFALRRRGLGPSRAAALLVGCAVLLYVVAMPLPHRAFYVLPLGNLALMLAGGALALMHLDRDRVPRPPAPGIPLVAAGLLVLVSILPMYSVSPQYRLVTMPAVAISTLVVLHGIPSSRLLEGVLSSRPLRAVGLRAYSLYLWHVPLMWMAFYQLHHDHSKAIQVVVALLAISIVVELSYRALERPRMHLA